MAQTEAQPKPKPKLWTRDFIIGAGINFLIMANYFALMVITADYAMEEYGAPASFAGLVASIFIVGALIARLVGGGILDSIGRRRMLIVAVVAECVMSALYFLNLGLAFLFIIRILHGISYGAASIAVSTIVTSIIPEECKGEGVGYFMLSNTLGTAIGPFMGMAISQAIGIRGLFAVCLAIALICLASLLWFKPPREERKPFAGGGAHLRDFIEPTAIPIGVVACLVFFGYASILTFLSSYAEQAGIQTAASFFFVAYAITMFVSRLFTGKIFDRRGANVVMIPAFVLAIVGMAAVGLAVNGAILLLGAALLGAGIGTLQSCGLTIALQKASVRRISLANSTYYVLMDGGVGLGPVLLGAFVPLVGYNGVYLAMAGLIGVAMVFYLAVIAKGQAKRKRP